MERFWAKTRREGSCIVWMGCIHKQTGYGLYRGPDGKTVRAHRFILQQVIGPLPRKIDATHSCDNRRCVALQHLSPGSRRANMAEAVTRGRIAAGPRHGQAKLSPDQVVEIKSRSNEPRCALAQEFGVSPQHISNIINGRFWK